MKKILLSALMAVTMLSGMPMGVVCASDEAIKVCGEGYGAREIIKAVIKKLGLDYELLTRCDDKEGERIFLERVGIQWMTIASRLLNMSGAFQECAENICNGNCEGIPQFAEKFLNALLEMTHDASTNFRICTPIEHSPMHAEVLKKLKTYIHQWDDPTLTTKTKELSLSFCDPVEIASFSPLAKQLSMARFDSVNMESQADFVRHVEHAEAEVQADLQVQDGKFDAKVMDGEVAHEMTIGLDGSISDRFSEGGNEHTVAYEPGRRTETFVKDGITHSIERNGDGTVTESFIDKNEIEHVIEYGNDGTVTESFTNEEGDHTATKKRDANGWVEEVNGANGYKATYVYTQNPDGGYHVEGTITQNTMVRRGVIKPTTTTYTDDITEDEMDIYTQDGYIK